MNDTDSAIEFAAVDRCGERLGTAPVALGSSVILLIYHGRKNHGNVQEFLAVLAFLKLKSWRQMSELGKAEALAIRVAGGSSVREASVAIGISESTGYRISATPEFRTQVSQIRADAFNAALSKLSQVASLAVDTLAEMLSDANKPADRIAAAKAILSNVAPLSDQLELRERMTAIETELQRARRIEVAA